VEIIDRRHLIKKSFFTITGTGADRDQAKKTIRIQLKELKRSVQVRNLIKIVKINNLDHVPVPKKLTSSFRIIYILFRFEVFAMTTGTGIPIHLPKRPFQKVIYTK
jgi:hypothetical protein